jgi:hypothetical protein
MKNLKPIERFKRRAKGMEESRSKGWMDHWRELSENINTRQGRFLAGENNDGSKRNKKIVNGVAGRSLRVLAAGMQGGLTSPAKPWFNLTLADKKLSKLGPVKSWLSECQKRMLSVLAKSNFYDSIHSTYSELGCFGTACMIVEEDFDSVIRCRPLTIGEYAIALDSSYRPAGLTRTFSMTAYQLVEEFGEDKVPREAKSLVESDNGDKEFLVTQLIEKNIKRDPDKKDSGNMPYLSVYFMEGTSGEVLRESGYEMVPFVAPRWDVTSTDTYGRGPGMEALGDIKMLQELEKDGLRLLKQHVKPSLNAPAGLKQRGGATIVTGEVNYIDTKNGNARQRVEPTFQTDPSAIRQLEFRIERTEKAIKETFYYDLFLMLQSNTMNMTAYEVSKRQEEKLLMLGPVLERLHAELLDVIIERVFTIMLGGELFPPVPAELQGVEVNVEYTSVLAQAQKMVGTTSISQVVGFIGQIAQGGKPEVLDKLNGAKAVDVFGDLVGVDPEIIFSEEAVAAIRQQRAQQQAQQMQQEQAATAISGAKQLSETSMEGNNALTAMMEGMAQQ